MHDNHEPKARARPRGIVRRKPECKRCEATDRNRIVKAEGGEASWHRTAKPSGTQPTVNAALAHRQCAFLPGESCAPWRRVADGMKRHGCCRTRNDLARDRAARSDRERTGSEPSVRAARAAVMHRVRLQKSAEAIVVSRCFTRVAWGEGPNMRSKAKRWTARFAMIKPDRVSRDRRRSMPPALCAFCA